jgi:hypothetical protein
MPLASLAALQWYGPACAAMVVSDSQGTLHAATPARFVRAGVQVTGTGSVEVMRPYRCRNAAIDAGGLGTAQMTPKRWVRTGLSVAVNELTASDVEGALLNMRIEGGVTFVQAMRAILAVAAGNASGLEGSAPVFKAQDGTTTRIAATYSGGNRTITTLDLE